jgi:capsular polysaccharide transport system ATP-binding protein
MLKLRNLTKWYPTPRGRRYVFRDLNFTFPPGKSIGLIGRNGAGKSTLMRLTPNAGAVVTDARISWPVGLSGGFHPALTARENVQFVCRVYGATGAAMRRVQSFVEEFAEIGEYFNLPVGSFSSGMRSRVAFGMSMAFDFDYYLIDEVMAVGDASFRRKSRSVMAARLAHANVILVSHSMADIARYCSTVVLVDGGKTVLYEDVKAGIAAYENQNRPTQHHDRIKGADAAAVAARARRAARAARAAVLHTDRG